MQHLLFPQTKKYRKKQKNLVKNSKDKICFKNGSRWQTVEQVRLNFTLLSVHMLDFARFGFFLLQFKICKHIYT